MPSKYQLSVLIYHVWGSVMINVLVNLLRYDWFSNIHIYLPVSNNY